MLEAKSETCDQYEKLIQDLRNSLKQQSEMQNKAVHDMREQEKIGAKLRMENEQLKNDLQQLGRDKSYVENTNVTQGGELTRLQLQADEYKRSLKEYREQETKIMDDNTYLKDELEKVKRGKSESEKQNVIQGGELTRLQLQADEYKRSLKEYREQESKIIDDNKYLKDEIQKLRTEKFETEKTNRIQEEELIKLRLQVTDNSAILTNYQHQCSELQTDKRDLQVCKEQLMQNLNTALATQTEIYATVDDLKHKKGLLELDNSNKCEELRVLYESAKSRVARLQTLCDKHTEHLSQLEGEIASANTKVSKLTHELKAKESTNKRLQSEITELTAEVEERVNVIDELSAKHNTSSKVLKGIQQELTSAKDDNDILSTQNADLSNKVLDLNKELDEYAKVKIEMMEKYTLELSDLKTEINTLKVDSVTKTGHAKVLEQKMNDLQAENDHLHAGIDSLNKTLTRDIEGSDDLLKNTLQKNTSLSIENAEMRRNLKAMLQKQQDEAESSQSQSMEHIKRLNESISKQKLVIDDLDSKCVVLRENVERLEREREKLNFAHHQNSRELKEDNVKLEKKLEQLQRELNEKPALQRNVEKLQNAFERMDKVTLGSNIAHNVVCYNELDSNSLTSFTDKPRADHYDIRPLVKQKNSDNERQMQEIEMWREDFMKKEQQLQRQLKSCQEAVNRLQRENKILQESKKMDRDDMPRRESNNRYEHLDVGRGFISFISSGYKTVPPYDDSLFKHILSEYDEPCASLMVMLEEARRAMAYDSNCVHPNSKLGRLNQAAMACRGRTTQVATFFPVIIPHHPNQSTATMIRLILLLAKTRNVRFVQRGGAMIPICFVATDQNDLKFANGAAKYIVVTKSKRNITTLIPYVKTIIKHNFDQNLSQITVR
ncbi:restin homolog [Ptychodera flava]|uniref:restin homolog n=1 Tax=Ptychodera flava TaxID=63121 RepID=UPI00396A007F